MRGEAVQYLYGPCSWVREQEKMNLLLCGETQSMGLGIPGLVHPQLLLQLMPQPKAYDRPQLALQT